MRDFAATKRWHTKPIIGEQTVAEHSYHVAMLCIRLAGGNPSVNLLKGALYHDLAETETGDVPAPAKWRNPDLNHLLRGMEQDFEAIHGLDVQLTAEESLLLRLADSLELAFYCIDQLMLGNRHMSKIYGNIMGYITNLTKSEAIINEQHADAYEDIICELRGKYDQATS